ncbi:MAG: FAD-dependent oxidoreductase [Kaiparowitsia implicata GSE-PSE-MK54-09C]|nr:FAD-dependent oxidoreductase [Kaiparowitsia implicata GSE-PSE-MK54-09C]
MIRFLISRPLAWLLPLCSLLAGASSAVLFSTIDQTAPWSATVREARSELELAEAAAASAEDAAGAETAIAPAVFLPNGRPALTLVPEPTEVWECEVAIIGGTLGGVAAAAQAMQAGAKTCLIELTPWLGGQISSQGVSAIDESLAMIRRQNFSPSWLTFKQRIKQQAVALPDWTGVPPNTPAQDTNSCWVGLLCFPPLAGANAAQQHLEAAAQSSPGSQWAIATAFKAAEFDPSGRTITALYGVRRIPRHVDYVPSGRASAELQAWYSWENNDTFEKQPLRLQPPAGQQMVVIDATDTGELVAWARVPHRVGSESRDTTGEPNASDFDNPSCTQAFTFPFALGIHDDQGESLKGLDYIKTFYGKHEHQQVYTLEGAPMFSGRSLFNYRRIVSSGPSSPFLGNPAPGDITMINWTQGNDWNWMDPPLILTDDRLLQTNQYQNWMGGVSKLALRHAENHALTFAQWLLNNQTQPGFPLTYLSGHEMPMGTESGLSMVPYIREGRRILGRSAYGQSAFMIQEQDIRSDMQGRDFRGTTVAIAHYDIDIHGCRYRNWGPTGEATRASVKEHLVSPIQIPIESLIPQGVDNMLIGGKAIAATHIANAATRVHYGEWGIGSASGAIAAWLTQQTAVTPNPANLAANGLMPEIQAYLESQGVRTTW